MAMRVADYIFAFLAGRGISDVFLVTGGGAMFLDDALRRQDRIRPVCCHHEQAATIAAEAHARISGLPGVACVTTGPGGINAMNGVFGAWTDSIPMIVVSGQVKRETCLSSYPGLGMRQLGDQEVDIISLVRSITKYASLVDKPEKVRYHLERAWHEARSGSPGPVWLDVPVDVQSALVEPESLVGFTAPVTRDDAETSGLRNSAREVAERLALAQRPVLLAGTGVRLADALESFEAAVERLGIPVTTAWTHDLIASDNPHFCGRQGTIGTRAGNFTVQNADLLLVVGARLTVRQVGYNWQSFAPRAYKVLIDVDEAEFGRPMVRIDLPVKADAGRFLTELIEVLDETGYQRERHAEWLGWCRRLVGLYPPVRAEQRTTHPPINPYHFMERLFEHLAADDVVVCGNASATIVPFQVARIQRGQRLFSNSGSASMGYDLPAAVGAAAARPGRRVICLAGDGSLQMNIQELQTVRHHGFPVKLFVMDNGGYLSIRSTQQNFFGATFGSGPADGVSFPDYSAVAAAYGIPALRLVDPDALDQTITEMLEADGPVVCHVVLDPEQGFEPRVKSREMPDGTIVSPALEDMYPFLDRAELARNMPSLPQATARWTAVVFDLDGTLADTGPGIQAALAAALTEVTGNDSGVELADLSSPLDDLIRSVAPAAAASPALRQQLSAAFRRHYDSTYWKVAYAYPGAGECLRDLGVAGIRAFVVTNKRAKVARRLLEHLGLAPYIEDVVGQAEAGEPLPKSELMGRCLRSAGLDPAMTVVVGDSDQDAAMAAACHTAFILVTYATGQPSRASAYGEVLKANSLTEAGALVMQRLGGGNREP
jgi:acetolactate synthase-1/2/3 large subunit